MKLIGYKHCRSLRWIPCDSIFVSPGRMSLILSRQFNLEEQFTFAKQTLGIKKMYNLRNVLLEAYHGVS